MNTLDKLLVFLVPRNYKSHKKVTRFVEEITKNGEFIEHDVYHIYIKMNGFVFRLWSNNFPYAFLKKCDYTTSIDYFKNNNFARWRTFWIDRMPSRNAIIKFCERFNSCIFDAENIKEEIDQYYSD